MVLFKCHCCEKPTTDTSGEVRKYGPAGAGVQPPAQGLWLFDHQLGASGASPFAGGIAAIGSRVIFVGSESAGDGADMRSLSTAGAIQWSKTLAPGTERTAQVVELPGSTTEFFATTGTGSGVGGAGTIVWRLRAADGSVVGSKFFTAGRLAVHSSGKFVVAGLLNPLIPTCIYYCNADGTLSWTYSAWAATFQGVAMDSAGNAIAGGGPNGTLAHGDKNLIKFDPSGSPLWDYLSGASQVITSVAVDDADNIYIFGDPRFNSGPGLVKLNSAGVEQWRTDAGFIAHSVEFLGSPVGAMIAKGDAVFLGCHGNPTAAHPLSDVLRCYRTSDGSLAWVDGWDSHASTTAILGLSLSSGGVLYAAGTPAFNGPSP